MSAPTTYYAVARGRQPGIYLEWQDARDQVTGFSDGLQKKFDTFRGAQQFVHQHTVHQHGYWSYKIQTTSQPSRQNHSV